MPTADGPRHRPVEDTVPPRLATVLPVRGHSTLMHGCLEAIRAQELAIDELVVVDDSPEASLDAIPGVRLLRSHGRGPYAARNVGWRHVDADVVLFLDARSRPRPGWSRRIADAFADPRTMLAGSEVRVAGGQGLGARAGERQQFFRLANYLARPYYRPYLPTCNLAVRRSALVATGGFDEGRSGGDADLCWRVLEAGLGELAAVEDVLMDWIPRDRIRGYLEQNYRYGRSNYALRKRWAARGAPSLDPMPRWVIARRLVRTALRILVAAARRDRDAVVDQLGGAATLAFQAGYRVATDLDRAGSRRRGRAARVSA